MYDEEREERLSFMRNMMSTLRSAETEEKREPRLECLPSRASTSRSSETDEERGKMTENKVDNRGYGKRIQMDWERK